LLIEKRTRIFKVVSKEMDQWNVGELVFDYQDKFYLTFSKMRN